MSSESLKSLGTTSGHSQWNLRRKTPPQEGLASLQLNLSPPFQAKLDALSRELDPELYYQGLLHLGRELQQQDAASPESAGLFQFLLGNEAVPEKIRLQARREWDATQGTGSAGRRIEYLASRFLKDAADPKTIVPMLLGTTAFSLVRAASLGRLGKVIPNLLGFVAEVPTFALSSRALHQWAGDPVHQDPLHDLASAGLTLGSLKIFGGMGNRAGRMLANRSTWAPPILAQASTFIGLYAAHHLETALGLRAATEGATTVTDILASMLSLGVGAHLGHRLTGSRLLRLQSELELRRRVGLAPPMGEMVEQAPRYGKKALLTLGSGVGAFLGPDIANATSDVGSAVASRGAWAGLLAAFSIGTAGALAMAVKKKTQLIPRTQKTEIQPRPYQVKMLQGLVNEMQSGTHPWLGLASPMQTGKSTLSRFIIRQADDLYGEDTQILLLSSSRVITQQLTEDLLGEFESEEVGRYDGLVKDPQRITVASIYSLHKDKALKAFPRSGKKFVILIDETFFTQAPIVRKILSHFGVAEAVKKGNRVMLQPKQSSDTILIGLSGTAGALEGYHLSGHMDLLTALEEKWIRPMVGERVFPQISTQKMKNANERMVWWKSTEENAQVLTQMYLEKIHGTYEKNLIYVPTIEHGKLFQESLTEMLGTQKVHFVHSKMNPGEIGQCLSNWEEKGGALISVRMLSHGFRAGDAGSVFHTYQSSSEELFSQRTGRAWGVKEGVPYDPLYVLEATWDKERFSNLARLLGLVDYPRERLEANGDLINKIRRIKKRRSEEESLQEGIARQEVSAYFSKVPLLEEWRESFRQVYELGTHQELSELTGLAPEVLNGLALGALPTDIGQIEALQVFLGGREAALGLWVEAWEKVLDEVESGERVLGDGLYRLLLQWSKENSDLDSKAHHLSEILGRKYHAPKRKIVFIDLPKAYATFAEAIAETKKEGKTMTPHALATRAYEIYCEGINVEKLPGLGTFRVLVSGQIGDPQVLALLEKSAVVRKKISLNKGKALKSFKIAIDRAMAEGATIGPMALANRAHEIYCDGMDNKYQPSLGTFRALASGQSADPQVLALLGKTAVVQKQQSIRLFRDKAIASFKKAVAQAEAEGKIISTTVLADRAHEIYCEGLNQKERPYQRSFRSLVTGQNLNPQIFSLWERSAVIRKPKSIPLKKIKVLESFIKTVAQVEAEGKTITPQALAHRAYEVYCEGLNMNERSSQGTFRALVVGRRADPEVMAILDKSPIVQKRAIIHFNKTKVLESFKNAIAQVEEEGKTINLTAFANRAYEIYCKGVDDKNHPNQESFRVLVTGRTAAPEILALMEKSGIIEKQKRTSIDKGKALDSFKKAIAQAEAEEKTMSARALAHRAHEIYCEGLGGDERPSSSRFHQLVNSQGADSKILALLKKSPMIHKKKRLLIDKVEALESLKKAIAQAEAEGKPMSLTALADRTYEIYCQDLAEEKKSSQSAFRKLVSSQNIDSSWQKILVNSGIIQTEKTTAPREETPSSENPKGYPINGSGTFLAALGAGLATLLSPDIANAASDVGSAVASGGAWAGIYAALGIATAGILAMAVKSGRKKALLEKAERSISALDDLIFEAELGDMELLLALQTLEVDHIRQKACEGELHAFRLLQKLSSYYDNGKAREAIRDLNLDYFIHGPKNLDRVILLMDAAFWGNETAQWTLILERGTDRVIDKFFEVLPNDRGPHGEQIREKLALLEQYQEQVPSLERPSISEVKVAELIPMIIEINIRLGLQGSQEAVALLQKMREGPRMLQALRETGVEDLEAALHGNLHAWAILQVLSEAENPKATAILARHGRGRRFSS